MKSIDLDSILFISIETKPLLHDIMDTVLRVLNDGTVILSVEYAQTTA